MTANRLSDVTVRLVTAADHDDWYALWRGYQAFYKVDIPEETARVAWARVLDPAEPMAAALAFDAAGKAVGLVNYIRHRSFWTVGDYVYLQDLFVDDGVRGRGVGRLLIEHVYEAATAAGCSRVHWLTHETNANAMVLYDRIATKSGFVNYRKQI